MHRREGLERSCHKRTTQATIIQWLSIPGRCFLGSKTTLQQSRRALAVVDACKHFLPYLLGRPFIIQTDHRALTFLNYKVTTSGRLARWMDILRQLDYTITYRQGKANANADALSRQEWPAEPTACTTEKEGGDVRST